MSRIGIDFGHDLNGGDTGAVAIFIETVVNRVYGLKVIQGFQKLGHTVFNVTPVQNNLTLGQSLAYRVNKANSLNLDLFISCHVNAFNNASANGCEVEYISAKGKIYADRISAQIATLGFKNRGSVQRPNLYVLKNTDPVAILVEPFFLSNQNDCNLYNADKVANAIVKGITGKDIPGVVKPSVITKPVVTKPVTPVKSIPKVESIKTYRIITGSFSDEINADERIAELKTKGFESFKILL